MSTNTQTPQLAQGGNVVGQGAAVHKSIPQATTHYPNEPLLWGLSAVLAIAVLVSVGMYAFNVFHAFEGQVVANTTTGYTYTATYGIGVWIWLALACLCTLIAPPMIYLLLEAMDEEIGTLGNVIGAAVTGVILIAISVTLIPSVMLKQDLAAHANTWLQTNLHTTYDTTDELGAQDRFTTKLDALTIDGKTVTFYLSRANNTVLIRTEK